MPEVITNSLDLWTSGMFTKSTAGRGSNGTQEAFGIKKLRGLVLELAVRGKLVSQDPNDEPAKVLLDRIAKEKARLVAEGKPGRGRRLPKKTMEETPFEIPDKWEWTRLGDVGEVFNGNSISERVKEAKYTKIKGGLPFIATKDVGYGWQALNYENGVSIPAGELNLRVAHQGAVLICCEGGSAGKKCGITDRNICFGNKLYAIEPCAGVNPNYLLANYLTPTFFIRFSAKMTGIIGGISLANFTHLLIPLPPINEQHRIVAKIDELMALCDELERQQARNSEAHQTLVETVLSTLARKTSTQELTKAWTLIANNFDTLFTTEQSIDELKQTILHLAVMGKLVPQDLSAEPASLLLKRIASQRERMIEQGTLRRDKPSPTRTDQGKPFQLPEGWAWSTLPEIGELARGKSKHRPRNDPKLYSNGTIPMVQTGDVSVADPYIATYTALYNDAGLNQSRLWPKGTMCITIAANIADTGILAFEACFPDSIVGFIPIVEDIDVKYFEYFMRTAKSHLQDFAPSTAQKNINLAILGQLLVPLPPAEELERIVAKVDALMALCDTLKAHLADAQEIQVHLADAIVEQAVA